MSILSKLRSMVSWAWVFAWLFVGSAAVNIEQWARYNRCIDGAFGHEAPDGRKGNIHKALSTYIVMHNQAVGKYTANYYAELFVKAGREFDVDPLLLVVMSKAESHFDKDAVSDKGALGVMQVMPSYWATGKIPFVRDAHSLTTPDVGIRAGAYVLRYYIDKCGSLEKGIVGYHGGDSVCLGKAPMKESTWNYSRSVLSKYTNIERL